MKGNHQISHIIIMFKNIFEYVFENDFNTRIASNIHHTPIQIIPSKVHTREQSMFK